MSQAQRFSEEGLIRRFIVSTFEWMTSLISWLLSALALSTALLVSFPAAAESDTKIDIVGIARSASLFGELRKECSDVFEMDDTALMKHFNSYLEIGFRTFGIDRFEKVMQREAKRRAQEVAVTGRIQWCGYQRAFIEKMGGTDLFTDK